MNKSVREGADVTTSGTAPDVGGLPQTALSRLIDPLIARIGSAASWLWLVLVLVIIFQVAMRYLAGQGSIMLEELQWHIYGVGFLLGMAFCLQADRHVRIDVLAERFDRRTRAAIEIAGILVFLLPFALAVTLEGAKLAVTAWHLNEVSGAPGGLSHRWVVKSFIAIGFGLIALAGLSRLSRCVALLRSRCPAPPG